MNKIAKTSLGIAAVAAIAGAGAYMAFAWGPSRDTYTMQVPADHVVFNSITDNNEEIGNELFFVSSSPYTGSASTNYWSDNTQVENGKEYVVRIYVHNNAAGNLNLTAENVRAFVTLPTTTGTKIEVAGKISADNANPKTVYDSTYFVSKNGEPFNLAYVKGTAKYYNTKGGKLRTFNLDTAKNDLFTKTGVLLGYDQMDGKIPGCNQYSGYLTFHVKAQFAEQPNLEISKEVKILGTDTWSEKVTAKAGETVRYRIHVKNSGNTTLKNVVVRDILPAGLTYVKGSTTIVNTAHPKGVALSDGIVTDNGINLGDYASGAGAWLYFNATVDKAVSEKCNPSTLRNVAQTSAGTSTGTKEDTADVYVEGKTCIDGFKIDKMVKLPSESEWHETVTAVAGTNVDYRIRFTNTGNTTLNNVVIVDTLPANMTYVKGSSMLDGKALADGVVSDKGVNIGSVAAGKTATVTFKATVNSALKDKCEDSTLTNTAKGKYNNDDKTAKSDTAVVKVNGKDCSEPEKPSFKIDKMVQLNGGKEWSEIVTAKAGDKVRYRIQFKNTGNTTLKNVVIRDVLPAGLTYVKGSTVLYNKDNTNGKTLADGIVSAQGINIGNYAKGAEATVYFYATVNTSLKDNCEDTTLTNVVEGKYNNDDKTIDKDTADVKVNGKDCREPEPTPELPKTGAESMLGSIVVIAGTVTAAAYYIISRK
ncbi:DUF11 domain-containing protein [Candidatus Saccharibacteria bacterium]|nr:DUF11 domain-containing protein [Candidatus Saccharibacteria bacterium]